MKLDKDYRFLTSVQIYVQLFLEWINLAQVLFHSPESKVIDSVLGGTGLRIQSLSVYVNKVALQFFFFFNQKESWGKVLFKDMLAF